LPMFPDGVWMVELAPLSDQTLVSSIVASALEVREAPKVKPRRNPQRRR
jgi:predicted ATPase